MLTTWTRRREESLLCADLHGGHGRSSLVATSLPWLSSSSDRCPHQRLTNATSEGVWTEINATVKRIFMPNHSINPSIRSEHCMPNPVASWEGLVLRSRHPHWGRKYRLNSDWLSEERSLCSVESVFHSCFWANSTLQGESTAQWTALCQNCGDVS